MKKILFVSHASSRTGAPILLIRLIKEIKKRANFEIVILLKEGGELENEFEVLGKTFVWNRNLLRTCDLSFTKRFLRKISLNILRKKTTRNAEFIKEISDVDIIFNNTITNAALLREIPLQGKKVFSYFHELEVITEASATIDDIQFLNCISDKIFVPSNAVKLFLKNDYGIPEEDLLFLNYIIPQKKPISSTKCIDISKNYSIPSNKFVVGSSGTLHWRKGYEFLTLILRRIILIDKISDIHFVWIGADLDSYEYKILKNDLRKLNLQDNFTFIPLIEDIQPFLSKIDVLALPSREDAFPLVVLEAAASEIPCICFAGAGGIAEFVVPDAGLLVDYLDIDGMAEAIIELKNNSILRKQLGKRAKDKLDNYIKEDQTVNNLIELFNES